MKNLSRSVIVKSSMKTFPQRISLIMVFYMFALSFLTGCGNDYISSTKGYHYEIDGTEYSSNFYDHYMFVDKFEKTSDIPVVPRRSRELYKINNRFDIYEGDFGFVGNKTLLCSSKDIDEAKKYYSDSDNYEWYFIKDYNRRYDADEYVKYEGEVDYSKFHELASTFDSYDPVYVSRHLEMCDLRLDMWNREDLYTLQEKSKDGLFKSLMIEIYDYEGELYYYIVNIGDGKPEDKGYYFIKIPESLQDVFLDVIRTEK